METKWYTTETANQRGMGGLTNIFPVQCAGHGHSRAGGLCLWWRQELQVDILEASLNHILCTILHPEDKHPMTVIFVYGFPDDRLKEQTWNFVTRLHSDVSRPCLVIGDFNDILSPRDKLGGDLPDLRHLQKVTQVCAQLGLHEVDFTGYRYTWSNKRVAPRTIQERLDYALTNDAWDALWPVTVVSHLPRAQKESKRAHMFRFEELWLREGEECMEIITETWCRDTTNVLAKFTEIQNEQVIKETHEAEKELEALLAQEELWWSQRSRATWLQKGDKNTSFFHQKASQRRKRNMIELIKDDRGREFEDDRDISNVLMDYFMQLFATSHPSGIEEATNLVSGRITQAHLAVLSDPFTKEEVEAALFQMHPTKAPGIDDFPALFYKKIWGVIGDDVARFCLQILQGQASLGNINHTLLVLIPKIKKAEHATQFRPISLCNVIFKIVTKTIANRLKLILPDLICEAQSAFVHNRLITDNALIAHECFHYMKKEITGRNDIMALKLDMAKAYDRIEWSFLRSVMEKMGFPQNWVSLIMRCVSTVSFSIMLNGNPETVFSPGRGLRQGDPLSPYLFILCGEVFSALVERAVLSANLSGIRVARAAPVISHLLFADDSIVFARANVDEARTLQAIVATYERASGQVINLDKSMLLVSRNVTDNIFDELKQLLNVKAVESYDKYLGLPTVIDGICAEIDSMISRWAWRIGDGSKVHAWTDKWLPNGVPLTYRHDVVDSLGIVMVSDLIDKGPNRWRRDVVEEVFHPTTAAYILALPLGAHGGDDVLAWPHTTTGQYTSKTGYNYVCGLLALEQHESEVVEMCQSLVYSIWDVRNRVIFLSGRLVDGDVIDRALGLLVPISPAVREERGGTKAVWRRPQGRVIKLNFDASFVDGMGAGLGMVARNRLGEIMAAATSHPVPVLSSLLAEASGLRRSGNSVADFLAKNASTYADCVWVEEAPDVVSGLVDLDVIASRPVGP
ncbi:uncharacterized protein LOC130745626 [Lotus japonicus]|uniref:uncharacterized protein LOC130745626 n=1 Tax=Lotus japonicus TaxID=34305 RepID=UPI00258346B3|nr:uncharacterized protein LOC130745626 [Lotus japonicus]